MRQKFEGERGKDQAADSRADSRDFSVEFVSKSKLCSYFVGGQQKGCATAAKSASLGDPKSRWQHEEGLPWQGKLATSVSSSFAAFVVLHLILRLFRCCLFRSADKNKPFSISSAPQRILLPGSEHRVRSSSSSSQPNKQQLAKGSLLFAAQQNLSNLHTLPHHHHLLLLLLLIIISSLSCKIFLHPTSKSTCTPHRRLPCNMPTPSAP